MSFMRQQDVLGAHVAMDEIEQLPIITRGFVRGVKPFGDTSAYRDCHGRGQTLFGATERSHELCERTSVHVLHDEKEHAFAFAELFDMDDVGMIDARGELRFIHEHSDEARVVRETRMNDLDRNQS